MIAGGFRRYGYAAEAAQDREGHVRRRRAAVRRTGCPSCSPGLPRHEAQFPVQYPGANVPQAWAAGAIIRLIAILAGIHARTDARARGSTSTRRCRTGCPS